MTHVKSGICILNFYKCLKLKFIFLLYLYNKTLDICIYVAYIAGQMAGPIGLTFFEDTHG